MWGRLSKMYDALPVDPPVVIRAEVSLVDPDTCKFTVSRPVHPGGPFFFKDKEQAAGSPLVERLFQLPGVDHVLVADNVVTVGKESNTPWSGLKASIGAVIRTQLLTGIRAILETPLLASSRTRTDAEIRELVQELLDREVNRSIAAHGGKISIVDVQDATLYIMMTGGCQGCGGSQVTLKHGFELMVRRVAPEIVGIVDTTDHAAGKRPYYKSRSPETVVRT